jgi:hypothetical protein
MRSIDCRSKILPGKEAYPFTCRLLSRKAGRIMGAFLRGEGQKITTSVVYDKQ